MLLRFIVENLFCFANETEFSMVATTDDAHPEHRINHKKQHALRISALYGANAHGKSKLIEAMALAQQLILDGRKPDQKIPVQPFRLNPHHKTQPSRFEFTLVAQEIEYTYGFLLDTERIHEEWLFSRPNSKVVRLFERVTNAEKKTEITIGPSLAKKGSKERTLIDFLKLSVRENQLFLTECVERNFNPLKQVYDWFANSLTIASPNRPLLPVAHLAYKENQFLTLINQFLKQADTGIAEIKTKADPVNLALVDPHNSAKIQDELNNGFLISADGGGLSVLQAEKHGPVQLQLVPYHQASDGQSVEFKLSEESSGTQRLLQIISILFNPTNKKVFIIDELDRTLHPALSRLLIETFLSNSGNTQLIFTTHDTTLLDLNLLRRDEIWFIQKDQQGQSHIYALSTFRIRPDLKIDRGYLQGRFGAIPFIGDPATLGW